MSFNQLVEQRSKRRRAAYIEKLKKERERPCAAGERLDDHDCDFDSLIASARTKPCLTTNQEGFLNDMEAKNSEYGGQMFFSEAQHEYLEYLASKGARQADDQEDEE